MKTSLLLVAVSLGVVLALVGCRSAAPSEAPADLVPGDTLLARLARLSQCDHLSETTADEARCSAAATLSGYLLLGGDFATAADHYGIDGDFTYENVYGLQDALYYDADRDGEPGVFGGAIPRYDAAGRYEGWDLHPEDEYHVVTERLGLKVDRVYAPTRDEPRERRAGVERRLAAGPVVFVVGVNEDTETETFVPMDGTGNHYVLMFRHEGRFYALDSYRPSGRSALVELDEAAVRDHLHFTRNAIYALTLASVAR